MSVDVTFFEFTPFFSSHGQCMSHELISSHEGEVSFPSPTFQYLCLLLFLLLLQNLWLPSLILPCRFIRDLKIGMLCHMALMLHLLHSRFPTPSTPLLETNDLPIAYDKVNILVLNTQLEILCPIIVFHLVSPWLHSFACTMSSISIPSSYKLALLHLDGNMLWMRK